MINKTIGELARLCGGKISSNDTTAAERSFAGVSTDTRKVGDGQLFIPLSGERFDGHDYVQQARERGAAAAMWQENRPIPEPLSDWTLVLVDDPLAALQRLAAAYRSELPVRVVGITGSNGKTTTKDMVAAVLATVFRVHKTAGNLNNHIGLPLTILEMNEQTEAAVLEMGMSGFGEIELLTSIAKPDAAIITNIGDAHLLQLGSREGIARAKLEIASGLEPGGLLVYNGDEPLLKEALTRSPLPDGIAAQSFGAQAGNDWVAHDMIIEAAGSSFILSRTANGDAAADSSYAYKIPVPGSHNVLNAAAAIAVGINLGIEPERIKEGLAELKISGMRIETVRAYNGATVLNDAYNANPTAVRAAIDLVERLNGFKRKWLVLGDMLELGPEEQALHREIGAYITPDKADGVLTYGSLGRHIAEGAWAAFQASPQSVIHFEDKAELSAWLINELKPEDLVLVKGSRGMRMEEIVQALEQAMGG
ncbi:UDP-N-acetylmuramoyl-tripeptide--D-alanyl-D-alanine ligase [Paenibacillus abyssi]|uniref:UDP-N-acetylmuramoyl-tripeptide--D-alanyl-D-alanine ligase n=1 Tax=Paenibacillus abyssi TaxID=1340531 RepID=A0A917D623_9BACL|nr:UDP-N-acetylmuramoyl-tripeptide--D-alanyl-D-alanine ligase [Paenibacillus abyssi]GGG10258.1 UDP-N-acetylmuramoyl-tripeptide--D-alanyl-D-alanine ligase [Paenibacillus abyssi]